MGEKSERVRNFLFAIVREAEKKCRNEMFDENVNQRFF
jgi:hypothetical protein